MELLAAMGLLLLLAIAALRWGRDSRDPARGIAGAGGLLPKDGKRASAAPAD